MLLEGIELSTSPLPRGCSTTELQQRRISDAGAAGIPPAVRGTQAAGLAGGGLTWGGADHFSTAMDKETEGKPSARPAVTARAAAELAARRAREAAALRANLRRRKEQARARELRADDEVPR